MDPLQDWGAIDAFEQSSLPCAGARTVALRPRVSLARAVSPQRNEGCFAWSIGRVGKAAFSHALSFHLDLRMMRAEACFGWTWIPL